MNKKPGFVQIGRVAVLAAALAGWQSSAKAKQPNIVFILTDDHSIQTIGAYNSRLSAFCREQKVTPNLDKLAEGGALFPNSFCCNSLCSPSRAAILTGLHSFSNGVTLLDQAIRPDAWTFPVGMRQAGYQSAVIGKWHLGETRAKTDYWRLFPGQGSYLNPLFIGPAGKEPHAGYATDVVTDMSLEWLRARDPSKPFLLMMQHKAPHRPWIPPPRYYRWLADVKIPEPDTLFDDYAGRGTAAHNQKMEIGRDMTLPSDLKVMSADKRVGEFQRMTETEFAEWNAAFGPRNQAFASAKLAGRDLVRWKYQEYMKDYLRCIKAVDDSVGRILDYLKAEKLEEDTVVIYASDQGFYNGEHGWFDKRFIYEESLHMPLIVRWPGVVKPGLRPSALVQNIDYAPTLMEIAGGTAPAGLHGRSIIPLLRGREPSDWRDAIYYHYYDADVGGHNVMPHFGLRTARYTMAYFPAAKEWELFDLEKDQRQMRSVYKDPAYTDTIAKLKQQLGQMVQQYEKVADKPAAKPAAKPVAKPPAAKPGKPGKAS